jgi:protein SCO1/2
MPKNLFRQLLIGVMIGVILIAGFYFFAQPYSYQGSLIDPPLPAADFSLEKADGATFRLSEHQDKVVLLYFGYTACPDVCPTTLYDLAKMKRLMGEESAAKIEVVMITVDPERDTTEYLNIYVTSFDPRFIGLSGEEEALGAIWQDYGVYREVKEETGATGYLVDHTARVYVVDPNGNLRITFPFGMAPEAMADDLVHLLKSN